MKLRHIALFVLALAVLAGCTRRQPPAQPSPDGGAAATDARSRARADSIAMADAQARRERELRDAEMRDRANAMSRAREVLTQMIFFEYDSEQLSDEAQELLREKVEIMRANPSLEIRIEGHADERGSTEYNIALGQRRAESVRSFLATYGVSADRIATLSYGKERPMVDGEGEAAWARNRRAEFVLTGGTIAATGYDR
jgi:peptidoglycan-associated lipoprotein